MTEPQPKFGKCPVAGLHTDYRSLPATELQVFRAPRVKLTLTQMNFALRRRLARAWLLFPVYLVTEILVPWLRFGGPADSAFGHPRFRQLLEVARLSMNDGPCGRKGYYHAGLAGLHGSPVLDYPLKPVSHHSTPASVTAIAGSIVPSWKKLCDLGVESHRKLTLDTVCGWDIALTDKGPVIVECNRVPSMDVPCQYGLGGFLGSEYSQLLRQEILNFLDQLEPKGSRFRFEHD